MKYVFLLFFIPLATNGQPTPQPLSIGSTLPDVRLSNILNYSTPATSTGALKNKRVLLDFFASWCTACIKALPHLDSLQKGDSSFQIPVITADNQETIKALFKKSKVLKGISLPFVTGDTTLKKYFPHKFIPHQVWIGKEGKVDAITGSEEVTAANIKMWLSGGPPRLPVKRDDLSYDRAKPLLQDGNGGDESSLLFRSLFTGYLKGVPNGEGFYPLGGGTRYFYLNKSLLYLYKLALGFAPNRVVLEVLDSTRFIQPLENKEAWRERNLFSYEIVLPKEVKKQVVGDYLLSDLDRFFRLHGRIETRTVSCYALVGDTSLLTPSAGGKTTIRAAADPTVYLFINQPVDAITKAWNEAGALPSLHPIIVNETGYTGRLDLEIPQKALTDFSLFQECLGRYGLRLVPVERELSLFVLTDKTIQ